MCVCVCVYVNARGRDVCTCVLPFYQSIGMERRHQEILLGQHQELGTVDLERSVLTTVKCFHGKNAVNNHVHVLRHKQDGQGWATLSSLPDKTRHKYIHGALGFYFYSTSKSKPPIRKLPKTPMQAPYSRF